MKGAAGNSRPSIAQAPPSPPRLRLVGAESPREPLSEAPPTPCAIDEARDHVLVAGADERARARMLEELRSVLPSGTRFVQAGETWELVARAAGSRMVVLCGDLDGVSASSLLRVLARRDPTLPVLALGEADPSVRADAGGKRDGVAESLRGEPDAASA